MEFVVLTENRGYSSERNLVYITSGFSTVITFLVWGHLEEAFDQVGDYCHEHAPGLLDTEYVSEEVERLKSEGMTDDEAWEESSIDMMNLGNHGDYISSETIHYSADPSRAEVKRYIEHCSTEVLVA